MMYLLFKLSHQQMIIGAGDLMPPLDKIIK
jgi:hypothetical protein